MDDAMAGFFVGAALIGTVAFFYNENIHLESFEYGNKICEQNGGLDFISEDGFEDGIAFCKNGAEFKYNHRELRKGK